MIVSSSLNLCSSIDSILLSLSLSLSLSLKNSLLLLLLLLFLHHGDSGFYFRNGLSGNFHFFRFGMIDSMWYFDRDWIRHIHGIVDHVILNLYLHLDCLRIHINSCNRNWNWGYMYWSRFMNRYMERNRNRNRYG